MKKFRVRIFDEDIFVRPSTFHITDDGWLQFADNESVFAVFRDWTYFVEA